MPFDNPLGRRLIRQNIAAVEKLDIDREAKKRIFCDNAVKLLHLPLGLLS